MKFYPKNFLKFAIIAFALAISALLYMIISGVGSPAYFYAKAIDNDYSVFIPNKSEEYYALNSPIHAYSDSEITAVTENNKLIVFTNGTVTVKDGLTSLKQVKRISENLFYTDNANIYRLPVADPSAVASAITDSDLNPINGAFFDTNGTYLVTVYSTNIQVYELSDAPVKWDTVSGVQESPVAVNSSAMFYVAGNKICKRTFSAFNSTVEYATVTPSAMIADENYVYYVAGTTLYRLSISDPSAQPQELSFPACDYDLGKIHEPKGLSFRNGNLLITDKIGSNGSVQEFAINGTTLEFTGYAVASGLSAYNRVSANATDIERYGKYVAALDGKKLTVIDTENCESYNKNGYINKFVNEAPNLFALGNDTIMYSVANTVQLSPVKDGETKAIDTGISSPALDICYQSEIYYVVYTDGTKTTVVKIDEKTGENLGKVEFPAAATMTTADVFGNVYVADNATIYKYDRTEGTIENTLFAGAKKLATDLAGNLFVLSSDGKIYKFNETAGTFDVTFDVTGTLGTIKSFGLNFDSGELYFLINGKEQIFFTTNAKNNSLKDVMPSDEFNAATTHKTELKVYTAVDGANVYSVTKNNAAFNFNGLIEKAAEYPFMAKLTVNDNLALYALASENGVVLINEKELTEKAVAPVGAPEKAFLTTSAYAYALPIVEKDGPFALDKGDGKITLNKGDAIAVERAFNVLGETFYEAQATVGGEILSCYVPAKFTATVLSEKTEFETYTVEKVKSTALYKNADLTEELLTLSENETIRVLSKENGVLKVAAEREGGFVIGYIAENSLVSNPNTIVRNVLIILAVFGSLAGTISYFLMRRKR